MDTTRNKVWSSFVAIMVPPTVNEPLVKILTSNCTKEPACLPHITLLDPFLEPKYYDEAVLKLEAALTEFPRFQITMTTLGHFSKKKGSILWISPESKPANALKNLMERCMSVFPYCDEVTKISPQGYQPHVTLGKFSKKDEAVNQVQLLQPQIQPITFEVKEINILYREGPKPYFVRRTIPIGGGNSAPYFSNIPFSWEGGNCDNEKKDDESKNDQN